ncbi:heterogeneous nuclear ribonucleoproteins C [Salpingoeca rosetta]|uniref:Heterogeneous nuclear ribonucleoproteins C n=1 Tax=Salpingoeca rosetta (strain ATCC 50818 / BSB-021) TaxID=946362 RepID=F2UJE2_SALR5|nr:heterogeneous nuclear ribonucleoproteins C [Salpingoeca rosetta]EGD77241.1 heterogeneous nuclear ribonucleoproteins C [Salpingoeca rosetta]|eukprot:XP_004990585.1 heterogeneous nuclear ribonucleoproteins C [Salpingoeca rosetta]
MAENTSSSDKLAAFAQRFAAVQQQQQQQQEQQERQQQKEGNEEEETNADEGATGTHSAEQGANTTTVQQEQEQAGIGQQVPFEPVVEPVVEPAVEATVVTTAEAPEAPPLAPASSSKSDDPSNGPSTSDPAIASTGATDTLGQPPHSQQQGPSEAPTSSSPPQGQHAPAEPDATVAGTQPTPGVTEEARREAAYEGQQQQPQQQPPPPPPQQEQATQYQKQLQQPPLLGAQPPMRAPLPQRAPFAGAQGAAPFHQLHQAAHAQGTPAAGTIIIGVTSAAAAVATETRPATARCGRTTPQIAVAVPTAEAEGTTAEPPSPPHTAASTGTQWCTRSAPSAAGAVSAGREREIPPNSRIFVARLKRNQVTKADLEQVFSKYGRILEIRLNHTYGFVQFDNPRSARAAIDHEKGRRILGIPIDLNLATNKFPTYDTADGVRRAPSPPPSPPRPAPPAAMRPRARRHSPSPIRSDQPPPKVAKRSGAPDCVLVIHTTKPALKRTAVELRDDLMRRNVHTETTALRPSEHLSDVLRECRADGAVVAAVLFAPSPAGQTLDIHVLQGQREVRQRVPLSDSAAIISHICHERSATATVPLPRCLQDAWTATPPRARPATDSAVSATPVSALSYEQPPVVASPATRTNAHTQSLTSQIYKILGQSTPSPQSPAPPVPHSTAPSDPRLQSAPNSGGGGGGGYRPAPRPAAPGTAAAHQRTATTTQDASIDLNDPAVQNMLNALLREAS